MVLPVSTAFFSSYTITSFLLIYIYFLTVINEATLPKIPLTITTVMLTIYSLSIIGAIDIPNFISRYRIIILGLMFYIVISVFISKYKLYFNVLKVLIISTFIYSIYNYITYLNIAYISDFLKSITYGRMVDYEKIQNANNRYFSLFFSFAYIPIFFSAYSFMKSKFLRILALTDIILLIPLAVFSNYRITFLIMLTGTILIVPNLKKVHIFLYMLIFTVSLLLISQSHIVKKNLIVSRFDLTEETNIKSIDFRLNMWRESIKIGLSNFTTGVGLNNFIYYLPSQDIRRSGAMRDIKKWHLTNVNDSHNIFASTLAECGVPAALLIGIMYIYFITKDLLKYKRADVYERAIITSFWLYSSYSLTMPTYSIEYVVNFWLLRSLIDKRK